MTARRQAGHGAQHLIGDVQRFGLLSAATIVDRYVGIVDRATVANGFGPDATSPPEAGPDWMAETAAAMATAYLTLVNTTAALVDNRSATATMPRGIERLLLPPVAPGGCSEVVLWLHDPTATSAEGEVHATDLASSSGASIPREAVSVLPQNLDPRAPGDSKQMQLLVRVPMDQPPGRYHGLVLSSASGCEPMAVQLDVLSKSKGTQ